MSSAVGCENFSPNPLLLPGEHNQECDPDHESATIKGKEKTCFGKKHSFEKGEWTLGIGRMIGPGSWLLLVLLLFPLYFSVAHFLPQPDSSFPQPLSSGVSVCQEERYHRDEDPQILCNITLLPLVLNKVLSGLGTEDGGCC